MQSRCCIDCLSVWTKPLHQMVQVNALHFCFFMPGNPAARQYRNSTFKSLNTEITHLHTSWTTRGYHKLSNRSTKACTPRTHTNTWEHSGSYASVECNLRPRWFSTITFINIPRTRTIAERVSRTTMLYLYSSRTLQTFSSRILQIFAVVWWRSHVFYAGVLTSLTGCPREDEAFAFI